MPLNKDTKLKIKYTPIIFLTFQSLYFGFMYQTNISATCWMWHEIDIQADLISEFSFS